MRSWIKEKTWIDIGFVLVAILVVLLFLFGLTGCFTAKNLPKHNDKYPEAAATYASKKFPCVTGDTIITIYSDSSQYLQSIEDLNASLLWLNQVNDSLLNELIKPTTTPDTVCKKYEATVSIMSKRIQDLQLQLKTIKPTIEYRDKIVPKMDSALAQSLRLQLASSQKQVATITAKLNSTKEKLNWWKIVAIVACAIIGIATAFKIGKAV